MFQSNSEKLTLLQYIVSQKDQKSLPPASPAASTAITAASTALVSASSGNATNPLAENIPAAANVAAVVAKIADSSTAVYDDVKQNYKTPPNIQRVGEFYYKKVIFVIVFLFFFLLYNLFFC